MGQTLVYKILEKHLKIRFYELGITHDWSSKEIILIYTLPRLISEGTDQFRIGVKKMIGRAEDVSPASPGFFKAATHFPAGIFRVQSDLSLAGRSETQVV